MFEADFPLTLPLTFDPKTSQNPLKSQCFKLEARVGIEPTNAAFAEPCLTTWLPRHRFYYLSHSFALRKLISLLNCFWSPIP